MQKHNTPLLLAALALILSIACFMDVEEQNNQASLYCEMTQIYKETNGQYGWPEYKENAKCQ